MHLCNYKWPLRSDNVEEIDEDNLEQPLADIKKIIIPPLHVKLGLFTQFVKSLDELDGLYSFFK